MSAQNSSEILAHWRYAPDEWRAFIEYEKKALRREIRQTLPAFFLYAVVVISLIALVAAFVDGLATGALVLLLIPFAGLFLLFATGVHLLIKRGEQAKFEATAGDVQITFYGVNTNGVWFGWDYEENPWRLQSVRRLKQSAAAVGVELEILEFTCVGTIKHVKGGRQRAAKKWRVPVPRGKEREADFVIQRLYEAQAAFSQAKNGGELRAEPLGLAAQNYDANHDFTGSTVCRKCGASVEAVTHFKWKCK